PTRWAINRSPPNETATVSTSLATLRRKYPLRSHRGEPVPGTAPLHHDAVKAFRTDSDQYKPAYGSMPARMAASSISTTSRTGTSDAAAGACASGSDVSNNTRKLM